MTIDRQSNQRDNAMNDWQHLQKRRLFKWLAAGAGVLGLHALLGRSAAAAAAVPAAAAPALADSELWQRFCEQLQLAGAQILRPEAPADAFNRAEGYRFLTRVLRAALAQEVEFADVQFPVFYTLSDTTIKIGADNPDNIYLNAQVSGRYDYRISGHRGTVNYIGFSSKAGSYGKTGTLMPTGMIDSKQLQFNADGTFELIVSANKHPGNWLPMTADTSMLIVRQTRLDRVREQPAQLRIECLNGAREPAPLNPQRFAQQLLAAAQMVQGTAKLCADWAQQFKAAPNAFPPQDQSDYQRGGGDPVIFYVHGYWQLAPDEALVVEVPRLQCDFWNFQVDNYWMESLDYRYYTIHLNKSTVRYNAAGGATLVIAHRDPGVPNWLNTTGHALGTMLFRVIRGDKPYYPTARLVKLKELQRSERA
jgi:hypothetical protein